MFYIYDTIRANRETKTHPGPTVLHQVPLNSISASPGPSSSPTEQPPALLSFPPLSTHLIPRHEFCNRPLTLLTPPPNPLRVISHPVCIHDSSKYERNDFIFNFAIVVDAGLEEWGGYKGVVRRLAGVWRGLEEWGGCLSGMGRTDAGEDCDGGGGEVDWGKKVFAMMEQVLEDLNNYCECMIPIDESTTINIKLFPQYPPPPPIKPHHVPISTVQLDALMDVNWDLTMQKACTPSPNIYYTTNPLISSPQNKQIIPHINGLNSISRIASLAEADLGLVIQALSHLLYYNCLLITDIFQFSAIYAVTAEISILVTDKAMQLECASYIAAAPDSSADSSSSLSPPSATRIISLYASLRQGLTLRQWCLEQGPRLLDGIDIRRFISFGIVKGFLYRVHKYAIKTLDVSPPPAAEVAAATAAGGKGPTGSLAAMIPGAAAAAAAAAAAGDDDKRKMADQLPLARYLDGTHCLDEICTDLGWSEKDVLKKLSAYGDVQIIHK